MARSQASDSETEAQQIVEIIDSSDEENVSVSNKSPQMPSSVSGSPAAQPPPNFWIELPPLPKDHQQYRLIQIPRLTKHVLKSGQATGSGEAHSETSEDVSNDTPTPEKIVGEHSQSGKGYYFARAENGIFTAHLVKSKYSKLVKQYEREKKNGTLSDFDPTSTSVHPRHRLNRRPEPPRQSRDPTRSKSSRSSTAAYESEATEADSVSSASDGDSDVALVRQSSRIAANTAANTKNDKPVSRKLRNLNRNNNAGSSSEFEDKVDSGSDYTVSSGAGSGKKRIPPIHVKRTRRPRQTVQGLGVVRPFTEAVDSDGDNEESVLLRHRQLCEACGQPPAFDQLEKFKRRKGKNKPRKRKKDNDDESSESEGERLENLGGWVRCLRCCVVGHWGCLSAVQRQEILMMAKRHENELARAEKRAEGVEVTDDAELVDKRKQIWLDEATEFICGQCSKGGRCLVCKEETAPRPAPIPGEGSSAANAINLDSPPAKAIISISEPPKDTDDPLSGPSPLGPAKPGEVHARYVPFGAPQILFRCITCRRSAHWQHLPPRNPKDKSQTTASQIARAYLEPGPEQWKCHECARLKYPVESILGWRPDPPEAVETLAPGKIPKPKDMLPREYLVKFKERGFKRVEWVPHMWMLAMHEGLLRHFLKDGTKLQLLEDDSEEYLDKIRKSEQADDKGKGKATTGGALGILPVFARSRSISAEGDTKTKPEYDETPGPVPDADQRVPTSWLRIDRVLDIRLRRPKPKKLGTKILYNKKKRNAIIVKDSDDEDEIESESEEVLYDDAEFVDGEEPASNLTESVSDFELREDRMPTVKELLARAVWVYYKFEDLQYDECAWDSPPGKKDLEWDSYKHALSRYLFAQSVQVLRLTKTEQQKRDKRPHRDLSYWSGTDLQPNLEDKSLKLMPFQVQGLQWLYGNWHNLQPSILADDMGLGKTVQLVSLVGRLVTEHVFPHLVVVPNSTIVNWIREFERWAPHVRVVRFNGEAKARQVIKKYELWNADGKQMYHALVTTYETLSGADFHTVFKKPGRWEMVVVDEGQRLKNDSSLLFRKLNELHTVHRILMTGTPLNNNIRELFNLMNFLDPQNWNNLDELEKEYDQENLTEELIARLHERLRPYFLRRQKAEVLDLPVKHEVIVPVSLAPIQKDIMRAILELNIQSLGLLADKTQQNRKGSAPKKTALHNALMEMRKCIQHPYLNQPDMERRGLSQEETLKQLVDASAKFRLLKIMLPQLKKRGHRVLLFSQASQTIPGSHKLTMHLQFKIVLDIIEDFLTMEGYKLLRLDGDTKSSLRQKEIDEYNKPDSDYFIYILTTRAGGVGVNLWSADTVIVFDPDFNPHQDLQAIARAHRYGQKKRVIVFKLMGKNTPEEKIFMMGKKKLVLDHLIVQKLGDEDEMEDIQGILMFGAKALFENPGESASDIKYTEKDVEELIIRAETEKIEEKQTESSGMKFDFAQVWNRQGVNTEIGEDNQDTGADDDFWAGVIKRAAEEKEKKRAQVLMGRGARKRAVANYKEGDVEESPERKPTAQSAKIGEDEEDDIEFKPGGEDEESSSESEAGSKQMPSSEDYPLILDNPTIPPVGQSPTAPYGYPGYPLPVGQPVSLGTSSGPFINANPGLSNTANPKPKKPKKPIHSVPSTSTSGQPGRLLNVSGLAAHHLGPGNSVPRGISADELYLCPHCQRRHGAGGCEASGLIDKLLQTHREIIDPDNEDEPDHKYWALQHIERKLRDEGFDISQITRLNVNPASSLKAKAAPNPKPKPKKPRATLPQNVGDLVGNVAGPSTSHVKVPKKPKPASVPGPSRAAMAPPAQTYGGPGFSHSHISAPPPFAAPKPTATFASSTADAFNAAARATHIGQVSGYRTAPQPQAGPQPSYHVANTSGRTVSLATPNVHLAPPSVYLEPAPRAVSHTIPNSSSSVTTAKRPAGSPPEETRKKQKYGTCIICDQKPGHLARDCPNIRTLEGLQDAIKRLESKGPNAAPVLAALRHMLEKRSKSTQVA